MASAARSCDVAANSSCASRLIVAGRVALGAEAHQAGVERAPQAVGDDRVAQLGVAVAEAAAGAVGEVRRVGHRLHAAGDDDVGLAGGDHLVGEVDGVEPGQAHLVDVDRRHAHRDAGLDGGLAARHLALAGHQHLAHDRRGRPRRAPRRPARARRRWRRRRGRRRRGRRGRRTSSRSGCGRRRRCRNLAWRKASAPFRRDSLPAGNLPSMQQILEAIQAGASGDELANLPLPDHYRAAFVRREDAEMFAGHRVGREGPDQEPAHRRRRHARAGARRGVRRGDGVEHQLQHGVDVDLRAAADVRLPRPATPARARGPPATPCRTTSSAPTRPASCCASARRCATGSPGDRVTIHCNSRRRPGPVGPRRLDARRQPADLGLRDQLRRARRPDRRQGQPADAQADPPDVGGGGGQRAVQLDELPHARRPQRGAHEAGRHRARLGRHRRHRRLRHAVRAQRRRHAGRRRVVAGEGRAAQRARRRGGHRPQGRGLPLLVRRARPRTSPSGGASASRSASWSATTPTSCSSTPAARRWARRSSPASAAARSSRARRRRAT